MSLTQFAGQVDRLGVSDTTVHSLDDDPTLLKLVVHLRLGKQDPVEARFWIRLFIATKYDSTSAEIFQVGQQLEQLPTVVDGFESNVDVGHSVLKKFLSP